MSTYQEFLAKDEEHRKRLLYNGESWSELVIWWHFANGWNLDKLLNMPLKQLVLIDRRRKEELKKLQAKTQASRNASTQLRLFSCVDKKYIKGDMLK